MYVVHVDVHVDAADSGAAAGGGAVVHIDNPDGAGVGIIEPLAIVPPERFDINGW